MTVQKLKEKITHYQEMEKENKSRMDFYEKDLEKLKDLEKQVKESRQLLDLNDQMEKSVEEDVKNLQSANENNLQQVLNLTQQKDLLSQKLDDQQA